MKSRIVIIVFALFWVACNEVSFSEPNYENYKYECVIKDRGSDSTDVKMDCEARSNGSDIVNSGVDISKKGDGSTSSSVPNWSSSKGISTSFSSSVQLSSSSIKTSTRIITDVRDGKTYKVVTIGTQNWMAENLNYGSYLADNNSSSEYQSGAQKFCYGNKTSNCDAEGGLYQWHTAMGFDKTCGDGSKTCANQISSGNHQGICPSGWHVPKKVEWDALATALGGTSVAGGKMKVSSFGGDNRSGFSALGAGYRSHIGGFHSQGSSAYFWEVEEGDARLAPDRHLYSGNDDLDRNYLYKSRGFSVRCLRN